MDVFICGIFSFKSVFIEEALWLSKRLFPDVLVCPKCNSLYNYDAGFKTVGTRRKSRKCSFVEFPNHRQRKATTMLSNRGVSELFPLPKRYCALSRKLTQADRSALYEDLKEDGKFTGFCWLLSPEPRVAKKLPMSSIEEIIFSDKFLQAKGSQEQLDCLIPRSKLDEHNIARISELTVGQIENAVWRLARRGKLTASNFGSVLKANRVTPSLVKRLLGECDLSRVIAVQWVFNNAKEAIGAFTFKTWKIVKDTGIWFDSSGILGASPDGKVDDETVLEAKCPYTERNLTIEEPLNSTSFCLEKIESGQGYTLRKDHVYWDQVQGQMYLSCRKLCFSVVWTTRDVAVMKIERDDSWSANIPHLSFIVVIFSPILWKEI